MDEGSLYKERIEKGKREQLEREKALARDAAGYDPKKLKSRMPWGCGFLAALIVATFIFAGIWSLVRFARGW